MGKKAHATKKNLTATEIPGLMETRSTEWKGYQVFLDGKKGARPISTV